MARKHYTPEQIIKHLREAEIFLGKGDNVAQACKKIGVSEQTYYRWRREYGGMQK
jgi:transposase-like protein